MSADASAQEWTDAWAQDWADAWNDHDVDRVTARYAADGSHRMAGGNTYAGRAAIAGMAGRTLAAYADLRFSVRAAFAVGNRFALEYTMRGAQTGPVGDRPGTGRAVDVDGALIGTRDAAGRITECIDYLDHHDVRRQLGLVADA